MFDFHTHILPGIDDGSRSVQESVEMLKELRNQGVSGIAATPHFYAQHSSPERFFYKRWAAWEQLKPNLPNGTPRIRLGAEVQYFEGIHRFTSLEDFCIEGTELLLVEMPVCIWTARMTDTILDLNSRNDLTVVLAHIERYLHRRNRKAIEELIRVGVYIQASTGFFVQRPHAAMRLLKEGAIHFLGTDAHNMESRMPDYAPAVDVISRKKGENWLKNLERRERAMLHEEKETDFIYLRRNRAIDRDYRLR